MTFEILYQQNGQTSGGKIMFIVSVVMLIVTMAVIIQKRKDIQNNIRKISNKYLFALLGLLIPLITFIIVYTKKWSYYYVAGITIVTICIEALVILLSAAKGVGLIERETICPSGNGPDGKCLCSGKLAEVQECLATSKPMCNNNEMTDEKCDCKTPETNCFNPAGLYDETDHFIKLSSETDKYITYYYSPTMTPDNRQDYIMSLLPSHTYPGQLWKQLNHPSGSFALKNMLFEDKYLYYDDKVKRFVLDKENATLFSLKTDNSLFVNDKKATIDKNGELVLSESTNNSSITLGPILPK